MKIIKRDGTIVDYNPEKIRIAIGKANAEVSEKEQATDEEINCIISYIEGLKKKKKKKEELKKKKEKLKKKKKKRKLKY